MGERRRSKRILQKSRAVINCYIRHNSFVYENKYASVRDLSMVGVRLFAYYDLPVGTECKMTIDLEGSDQILQLWGRVVWADQTSKKGEYEIGIEFLHTDQTRAQLSKHLKGKEQHSS